MNIAVIGLGLIGGSFCKAISKRTNHRCYGLDLDPKSVRSALDQGAIVGSIVPCELSTMDMTILCLHPLQSIEFVEKHMDHFQKNSIVIDSCGVKESIVTKLDQPLHDRGVRFLGCHPMAGREFSGFDYALDTLYDGASFIMTPTHHTHPETPKIVRALMEQIGFGNIVSASPCEHDTVIAFTSQLAHVVSNAYVKSPSLEKEVGFSAGSFLDLTRVAKLNENMWTDLFLLNQKALVFEIQTIISKLNEYQTAIQNNDATTLRQLLKQGSVLKERSIQTHKRDNQA